jgi:predicted  nucleic acid-binding Zn-ribbon protein
VSDNVPLEVRAFRELETLVRSLGEELAAFRRRALTAEARLREIEGSTRTGDLFAEQRLAAAVKENAELKAHLAGATERTRQMLDQVRFLRQQHEHGSER